jgi:hypothetical protein
MPARAQESDPARGVVQLAQPEDVIASAQSCGRYDLGGVCANGSLV